MSNNVEYSIAQIEGTITARAKVKSFNLDHVTDKDITSYYRQISSRALFDTGLLPLNGTGLLSIRSAGRHTQIAFQHAPQISYINWGAYEGDSKAKAYYLAQPYRIWIADLLDGSLYGARMFYSPYPITSPESELYHLNLPNTNCRGYRGNGVGWQCLYRNEDWSDLSFNIKVQKLIERCSGIEAYNDGNMSETDGPRFYQMNGKPQYLWDPASWQEKSSQEGFEWTLDPNLWIPVLVKDIDNQDKHYPEGQPLTFAMALLGNYNSYYNDDIHPKLVNAFARKDIQIPVDKVFDIFKASHVSSKSEPEHFDQFSSSVQEKVKIAETFVPPSAPSLFDPNNQNNDNNFICAVCENEYDFDEVDNMNFEGETFCLDCFHENYVYCENTQNYLPSTSDYLIFIEHQSLYIDSSEAVYETCENCDETHWLEKDQPESSLPIYHFFNDTAQACQCCLESFVKNELPSILEELEINYDSNNIKKHKCPTCSITTYSGLDIFNDYFIPTKNLQINTSNEDDPFSESFKFDIFEVVESVFCKQHALQATYCPSGYWGISNPITIEPWVSSPIPLSSNPEVKVQMMVKAVSSSSLNPNYDSSIHKHPFKNNIFYARALAAIHYEIFPYSSIHFSLYKENGEEYNPSPF